MYNCYARGAPTRSDFNIVGGLGTIGDSLPGVHRAGYTPVGGVDDGPTARGCVNNKIYVIVSPVLYY